jgi:hypothetical protein
LDSTIVELAIVLQRKESVMSGKVASIRHGILVKGAVALPLCLSLSGCGGGNGTLPIVSMPPPPAAPTPTPTPSTGLAAGTTVYEYPAGTLIRTSWLPSPATSIGNSGYLIGRLSRTPGDGTPSSSRDTTDFSITTQAAPRGEFHYSLNAPAGILPAGLTTISAFSPEISWDINPTVAYRYTNIYGDTPQYLGQRLAGFTRASDGTEEVQFSYDFTRGATGFQQSLTPDKNLRTTLEYDIGYSYVAMGEWSWRVVDLTGAVVGDFGDLLFVEGDHTAPTQIPASGSATYDARTFALLSTNGTAGIPFSLIADFGQRTMSARIDQDYRYDPTRSSNDSPILGIHVSGIGPISNDSYTNTNFSIALTGTANYSAFNSPSTPAAQAVTGSMNGSFFGPNAAQVGGVFSLNGSGGVLLAQDAFVGKQP